MEMNEKRIDLVNSYFSEAAKQDLVESYIKGFDKLQFNNLPKNVRDACIALGFFPDSVARPPVMDVKVDTENKLNIVIENHGEVAAIINILVRVINEENMDTKHKDREVWRINQFSLGYISDQIQEITQIYINWRRQFPNYKL